MGAVCAGGTIQRNEEVGNATSGKIKPRKNSSKKDDCDSNFKGGSYGGKSPKGDSKSSTPNRTGSKKTTQKNSFLVKAGERAAEVLDTLGSSVCKLQVNGGMAYRGSKISILAFEVANTISRGAKLFNSLSEKSIQFLKNEIMQSEGVQQLISTDMKELLYFAAADKRKEFNVFLREVSRFGNLCKDPQRHYLDQHFSSLDLNISSQNHSRNEAEKTVQELVILAQNTAELYHELNAFDRFEQDYQRKIQEIDSLNLPRRGETLTLFQSELKNQKKLVKSLRKKSLWSRSFDEIVEKLVLIVTYTQQAIFEFFGNNGVVQDSNNHCKGPQRLGVAGLALHYANLIGQINMIASRPTCLPPNVRDTLYHALPDHVKRNLCSRLQTTEINKKESISQVSADLNKTLQWLVPFATNTAKANQDFGWVGEWAKSCNEFGNKTSIQLTSLSSLQTLNYAEKDKTDVYILEVVTLLHHLICFVRSRNHVMKSLPRRSLPKGNASLPPLPKMQQCPSLNFGSKPPEKLSEEDRFLLEGVTGKSKSPGISRSQDFELVKKKGSRVWALSRSTGSSPTKGFDAIPSVEQPESRTLDVMDGLRYR